MIRRAFIAGHLSVAETGMKRREFLGATATLFLYWQPVEWTPDGFNTSSGTLRSPIR
jgi:hypothetical protein